LLIIFGSIFNWNEKYKISKSVSAKIIHSLKCDIRQNILSNLYELKSKISISIVSIGKHV